MADYTPVYVEGEIITLTAGAPVKGGDLLVVTGVNQVSPLTPASAPAQNCIGIAAQDAPSGRVSFYCRGPVHESVADGTVTAGDQVRTATNPNRQVQTAPPDAAAAGQEPAVYDATHTAAAVNLARSILGVALTTAADGIKVRWMMLV